MENLSNELIEKLKKTQSPEEVDAILKEADVDDPTAQRIREELEHNRWAEGRTLSLDELDAVSGGNTRDWATEGCAATVEPGSHCWSNDHCMVSSEQYDNAPVNVNCPRCGTFFFTREDRSNATSRRRIPVYYICKNCGHTQLAYYADYSST